ncbi:hypothetical protein DICVIV_05534 [Dictyocaulus viviparus]|uniref:Uncharacterized protein n=1 Tax=Dictyocaulus viviparus TaxID=29172 RepID=A0A0D8XUS3_DICVI|nr:hypothetical protein DICVIV_05534 [Dictyocaulus viviparus]
MTEAFGVRSMPDANVQHYLKLTLGVGKCLKTGFISSDTVMKKHGSIQLPFDI